ncbi:unnamed protein product [Closterium sp. Yama58-4]|nr:unnamed protein product [Closterium sp. Yama58-4]
MQASLARFSLSRLPPSVARAALGAAWVAGWAGLCAWVVWFAHSQAANPREEAMRAWCRTRVRYLQQDILSSVSRAQQQQHTHTPLSPLPPYLPTRLTVQEAIGLISALGHFGPRSSSNLSYWGLAGCVNIKSMADYNLHADEIGNFSTGTVIMVVSDRDRPLVERMIGHPIQSVLGLPAPRKDLYGVNVYGSINPTFPVQPFTDFFPLIPPDLLTNLLRGQTIAGAPLSAGPGYVAIVFVVPIFRHPVPASASLQEIKNSIGIAWAGVVHLEWRARELLRMLENGTSTYSFAMYDNTEPGVLKQIYGPDAPRLESGSAFPFVLPTTTVAPPEHVEPFPENMMGRTFEAHCGFQVPPPTWDLVYAPMLLGLLVLLVAVLLSIMIAVLAWKRRNIEADVKEIQICTAILERAERSKSEAVANVSHELRTPIIGMMGEKEHVLRIHACIAPVAIVLFWNAYSLSPIGMIEELLESSLEEWQRADLVDARVCAGETVELINRVLDLAKLQAGRLQLETLPCCLRRIVREATAFAPGKNIPVTFHVDDNVPETLLGDPTRLLQVMAEIVASAMNNTATGHITIHLWCIPPPHVTTTPPPPAAASGAKQASSEAPPATSARHQLAGCVRRFPPPTRLLCHPQRPPASQRGPVGNGGGQACCRDGVGSADDRQGESGRLEEEVREWVEGACAVREEGEWMVVVACEDTGGGIPPEELWGLLDPHGTHGSGQHKVMERIRSLGRAESWKGLGRTDSKKGLGRLSSWRQRERSTWDPLQRDRKAAAGPRWTPYPVRFLLSTSLVAEMRGGMAVLSDAATGTTILLALPMGEQKDSSSTEDEERSREECGESEGASEERLERRSGSQEGMEGPAKGATAQPAAPQQRQAAGARALVHAHTFPQSEVEEAGAGVDGAREAERVVRGVVAGRGVAVVDDNAVNRMVARRTLQGYGAHVLLLCSGEDALQALSSAHLSLPQEALSSATPSPPIHLLLLDLHMPPGMDGSVPCSASHLFSVLQPVCILHTRTIAYCICCGCAFLRTFVFTSSFTPFVATIGPLGSSDLKRLVNCEPWKTHSRRRLKRLRKFVN